MWNFISKKSRNQITSVLMNGPPFLIQFVMLLLTYFLCFVLFQYPRILAYFSQFSWFLAFVSLLDIRSSCLGKQIQQIHLHCFFIVFVSIVHAAFLSLNILFLLTLFDYFLPLQLSLIESTRDRKVQDRLQAIGQHHWNNSFHIHLTFFLISI